LVAWESRKTTERTRADGSKYNKVDVVAHVFCVVNRTGGTETTRVGRSDREKLPPYAQWDKDCWIVDPWLASLGWESCYKLAEYPKKGFLSPVYLEMDSADATE
jgi:hypothetical protein